MRVKRFRRLPVPQPEFGFAPDAFALFSDSGVDGERMARERAELAEARRRAAAAQAGLFASTLQPFTPSSHE